MKRARLFLVAALAVGSLGITAAPALGTPVCDPDGICPDCDSVEPVSKLWRKLFGYDPECA